MQAVIKLPSQVKIKNKVVYEIVHIESFSDPNTLGECRFDAKQIVIKKGQTPSQEFKTLTHELLHAISEERGIQISHKAIYQLEHAIEYLLKANKWI